MLDGAGAADWNHKQTVAHLEREHPEVSSWWRQSITVGYEQARGKRVVGETADAGFEIGVQRTVVANPTDVWRLLTSRPDLWLGQGVWVEFSERVQYEVPPTAGAPGARGEIRVVKPGVRLRMTWHPDGWAAPATLQLTLAEPGPGKTAINAHMEKLPDAETREVMRQHWRTALERIATGLSVA